MIAACCRASQPSWWRRQHCAIRIGSMQSCSIRRRWNRLGFVGHGRLRHDGGHRRHVGRATYFLELAIRRRLVGKVPNSVVVLPFIQPRRCSGFGKAIGCRTRRTSVPRAVRGGSRPPCSRGAKSNGDHGAGNQCAAIEFHFAQVDRLTRSHLLLLLLQPAYLACRMQFSVVLPEQFLPGAVPASGSQPHHRHPSPWIPAGYY